MENLVIHPRDASTVFLKPIYRGIENKTVIESGVHAEDLKNLIRSSSRIIAMGHGSPSGLFNIGLFLGLECFEAYVIGEKQVDALKGKDQNIYIWCHANKFVDVYGLNGFYSGMFISEVYEAFFCGIRNATKEMVFESNNVFSEAVGEYIDLPKEKLHEKVSETYGQLAKSNPVAAFNLERLCVK